MYTILFLLWLLFFIIPHAVSGIRIQNHVSGGSKEFCIIYPHSFYPRNPSTQPPEDSKIASRLTKDGAHESL